MLADGFDVIVDLRNSQGSWLVDHRDGRRYIDFFTGVASMPLGYNHPKMMRDSYPELAASNSGKMLLALLSGAPLLVGMAGCFLGGTLSDRYIKRTGNRKVGRRMFGMIGYTLAGICYLLAAWVKGAYPDDLWLFAGVLIAMGFFNDLIMGPAWATCQDIGREYAATVSGAMNMVGNLVGAVSGIYVTKLIMAANPGDRGFQICFVTYSCVYFAGVGLWMLIDASKPVVEDE
jgi:MFS family permease